MLVTDATFNVIRKYVFLCCAFSALLPAQVCLCFGQHASNVSHILIDRSIDVGNLYLYPSATNPDNYYYAPNVVQLDLDESGKPKFSYTTYRSDTGLVMGVLHMVLRCHVPERMVKLAEAELKQAKGSASEIIGPFTYTDGRVRTESGGLSRKEEVIDVSGKVDSNGDLVVPITLTFEREFETLFRYALEHGSAGLINASFEMQVDGLSRITQNNLEIDWDELYKRRFFKFTKDKLVSKNEIQVALLDTAGARRIFNFSQESWGYRGSTEDFSLKILEKILKKYFIPVKANTNTISDTAFLYRLTDKRPFGISVFEECELRSQKRTVNFNFTLPAVDYSEYISTKKYGAIK